MDNFFAALTLQTIMIAIVTGITGFVIAYIIRSAKIARQKEKIYNLEDEMLSSHARILELQKELGEVKAKANSNQVVKKAELKVS